MLDQIIKYPRTQHLEGSRLQAGDEDLSQIPFEYIKDKYIVIEEKVDGANCGFSFADDGTLLLQSRGHYLTGGYRERHFNLFKQWAASHQEEFFNVIGTRYIVYGEWLYAKHTVYYDKLPHYFLEFDVYDKIEKKFLSTKARRNLLQDLPISSVPVLASGKFKKLDDIIKYLGDSNYKTPQHRENLVQTALNLGLDSEIAKRETDASSTMEGLYIKVESDEEVIDRVKYVRYTFLQTVVESTTHWLDRPIIPNKLDKDISELF